MLVNPLEIFSLLLNVALFYEALGVLIIRRFLRTSKYLGKGVIGKSTLTSTLYWYRNMSDFLIPLYIGLGLWVSYEESDYFLSLLTAVFAIYRHGLIREAYWALTKLEETP